MYITHMLLVWQYFYLKLTIRDNGSSIWNHGTTINFGLSGIMVLLFHMVLLMIGAKIHYGTCIPYTPSIQDLRVSMLAHYRKRAISENYFANKIELRSTIRYFIPVLVFSVFLVICWGKKIEYQYYFFLVWTFIMHYL